jgi:hypothetical protein
MNRIVPWIVCAVLCSVAIAEKNVKLYTAADKVAIKSVERELDQPLRLINNDERDGGVNAPVRVKKIGQDDTYQPIPKDHRANITASIDWDSFHDELDDTHGYAYVGEHCNDVLYGLKRLIEYGGDEDARPIIRAAMREEIKSVRFRFDRGAFVDKKTQFRGDVLRLAGGVLTVGFNWDTATKEVPDRTMEWLKKAL